MTRSCAYGFLFCSTAESSWVLLFWKDCESVWLLKTLSGDLEGQSPKIWFWTSFGPRSDLVRTSLKLQPVKTQPGKVLDRLCNGLLLGLLLLLLLLLLLSLLVLLLLGKNSGPPAECNDFYNFKIVGDKKSFSKSSVHMGETIRGMT